MGNDGGSIPKRCELVKEAAKNPSTTEIKESLQEKQEFYWTTDPLSNKPLRPPIVSDYNGKLYNKQSILEYLLPSEEENKSKKAEQEKVLYGSVKILKDVVEVHFHGDGDDTKERNSNGAVKVRWICPITNKALGPGSKAVYLVPCGHAFTSEGVKEVKDGQCVTCGQTYAENDVIPIVPTKEEDVARLQLRIKSLRERGLTHSLKESKKPKDKKRKHGDEHAEKGKKRKRREENGLPGKEIHLSDHKSKRLPFKAKQLHKDDFKEYEALFADYLDVQKELDINQLSQREVYGRWKSFIYKWNDDELAEGWYDPATKKKAVERFSKTLRQPASSRLDRRPPPDWEPKAELGVPPADSDEDDFGPALPFESNSAHKTGPAIPSRDDLQLRDELRKQDRLDERRDLAYHRKQDRRLQRDRLEDLVPRAEPGTRERQLEKKREVAASNKAFADRKSPGVEEFGDRDLMGDDGIEAYKRQKREHERRKTEREIKKEEIWRARAAEREEKLEKRREKEQVIMDTLRQLAAERYG